MISRMALLHGEGHSLDAGGWGMAEQLPSLIVFRAVCIGKAPQSQRNEKKSVDSDVDIKRFFRVKLVFLFYNSLHDGWMDPNGDALVVSLHIK